MKESDIKHQIKLWAIVGPFVTLLTLLISMMKTTKIQPWFSLCLVVGIFLCWKWKLKGLAISASLLLAIISYHSLNLNLSTLLWVYGLGISALLSFLTTALSFNEVTSLIEALQVESKSRLENLLKLDEQIKAEANSYHRNHEKMEEHIKKLELMVSNLELSLSEREQELVIEKQKREEERSSATEKELVLREIINEADSERKTMKAELEKSSDEESLELRKIKKKLTQVQKQFKEKSEALDETRLAIFHMQEKLLIAQRELDEARKL